MPLYAETCYGLDEADIAHMVFKKSAMNANLMSEEDYATMCEKVSNQVTYLDLHLDTGVPTDATALLKCQTLVGERLKQYVSPNTFESRYDFEKLIYTTLRSINQKHAFTAIRRQKTYY